MSTLPLQAIRLDVDSDKSVADAINRIVREKDRIDVVVNNAGYNLAGAIEETSMDEMRAQFETNFFGAVKVMKAVIPIMRNQRRGKIVNITSVGGRMAIPFHSTYRGSKFALEDLSESIHYELEPFGIKVILIEPGVVGSNFWTNMKTAAKLSISVSNDSPYSQMEIRQSESSKQGAQNMIHPSEFAKVILQTVLSDNSDFRYVVGNDAAAILEARRSMSDTQLQDLIRK